MTRLVVFTAAAIAVACGGSKQDKPEPAAKPAASNKMVGPADAAPPAPSKGKVDCAKVAGHLTGLSKRDVERAGLSGDKKTAALASVDALEPNILATCKRMWNDDTRTCLLGADSDAAIKACKRHQPPGRMVKPLRAGRATPGKHATCNTVINHLLNLATREVAASTAIPAAAKGPAMTKVAQLAGVLKPMCLRNWSGALKTCLLAANTATALESCRKHMPADLKELEERVSP